MMAGSCITSSTTPPNKAGDWSWKITRAIAVASGLVGSIAAQTYTITDVGALKSLGDTDSVANGISSSGVVVGNSGVFDLTFGGFLTTHAFVWMPTFPNGATGSISDIGGLPGFTCNDRGTPVRLSTNANGVNSENQVVGTSPTSASLDCLSANQHAFVFSGGAFQDLGVIPSFTASFGNGINDAGQVAGFVQDSQRIHAFFYDGSFHDLNALPGFPFGLAGAVNNAGQIIGNSQTADLSVLHGFLHSGTGPLTAADDIGTLGGASSSANGINDQGVVIGNASLSNGAVHAFLLNGGKMTDLGTLNPGSFANSGAFSISSANDIVGNSETPDSDVHAVLWKAGGPSIVDLNTLIDPSSGWVLNSATGINAAGQIVGTGMIGGKRHAFLLTPPQAIKSLTFQSKIVCGTQTTTGTVTLANPAGAGASVTILSDRPDLADGPPTVTVPEGQTTASFVVTTHDVTANFSVMFTALFGGATVSATLTVQPLLASIAFGLSDICSRTATSATVALACPAQTQITVGLSSSDAEILPTPGNVVVQSGQTTATFSVTGGDTQPDASVNVTASFGDEKKMAMLTVHALLGNLVINPATVRGTKNATGTVSLTLFATGPACLAPHGGLSVTLLSDNSEVAKPSVPSITLPEGSNVGSFTITTSVPTAQTCAVPLVSGSCKVDIIAEAAGSNQSSNITVTQPGPPVATDVTQLVAVVAGGFRFDHTSGVYLQEVLVTNQLTSGMSISGPIALVLDNPAPPWTLAGGVDFSTGNPLQTGVTTVATPTMRPYALLPLNSLPTPGVLNSGDSVTVILSFNDPLNSPIVYNPVVLANGAF